MSFSTSTGRGTTARWRRRDAAGGGSAKPTVPNRALKETPDTTGIITKAAPEIVTADVNELVELMAHPWEPAPRSQWPKAFATRTRRKETGRVVRAEPRIGPAQ